MIKKILKRFLYPSIQRIEQRFETVNENINSVKQDINKKNNARLEAIGCQIMQQRTLERLQKKYNEGKKIRVFFLVVGDGKFVFDSIYKELEQSDFFEPQCILIHKKDYYFEDEKRYLVELQQEYEELCSRGYKVTIAYDDEYRPIPLASFSIDILFLYASYLNIEPCYFRDSVISPDFLTCYINYAMRNVKLNDWMYNNPNVNNSWINFIESYDIYREFLNNSYFGGKNIVVAGYPKLDGYFSDLGHSKFDFELETSQKTVVYAPHWSMCNKGWLNISTFHLYHDLFEQMMDEYPNVRFIFKPHPDIGIHLRKLKKQGVDAGITEKEYEQYIERWENRENGIVYQGSDYITLFRYCDALITDCGSFTSEWLPSKKPCIYLINPENSDSFSIYNSLGKIILNSYYCCHNEAEIVTQFKKIILENIDEKYEQRLEVLKKHFVHVGSSGKYIVQHLENALSKE